MLSTLKRRKVSYPPRALRPTPSAPESSGADLLSSLHSACDAEPRQSTPLPAEWLSSPDFLLKVARSFLGEVPQWKLHPASLELTYGTMCSGSEVAAVCADALAIACGERGQSVSFRQCFGCEVKPEKQAFGMAVSSDSTCCCFDDIEKLGDECAPCMKHNAVCKVERVAGACGSVTRPPLTPSWEKGYETPKQESGSLIEAPWSMQTSSTTVGSFLFGLLFFLIQIHPHV